MKSNMEHQLVALKRFYLNELPNKICAIEFAWKDYLKHPDPEKLQVLFRQARNMSGAAGTYGYKEISDIAKKMDRILREQKNIAPENKEKFAELITQLRHTSKKIK